MNFIWLLLKIAVLWICFYMLFALPDLIWFRLYEQNREWGSEDAQQRYYEKRAKIEMIWTRVMKITKSIIQVLTFYLLVNWLIS